MEPAKDQFHSLTTSVYDVHQSLGPIICVFYTRSESGTTKCKCKISQHDWEMASSLFNSILHIPNILYDERKDTFELLQVFYDLARHLLCGEHATHSLSLRDQWLLEFGRRRSEVLSELESYYGAINRGNSDTAQDEEDDDLEEDFDALPAHLLSTTEFKALCPAIKGEEVTKKVSKKLEQQVGKRSRKSGCVYIISPQEGRFEGMLKIGYSLDAPENSRFPSHKRCFGEYVVIKVRPVKFAHRVEQLLLAEFSGVRFGMKCHRCPRTHQEWLKIEEKAIIESLDRWCTFVDEVTPYNAGGRLKTLPENVVLPSPASREYLGQRSSARSTPKKTPKKNASAKKAPAQKTPVKEDGAEYTPTKKAPAKRTPAEKTRPGEIPIEKTPTKSIPAGTPTKSSQHWPSPLTSPSYSRLKSPTISTTACPSSDEGDSMPQVSEMGPEEFATPPPVGKLTALLRHLKITN